MKNYNAEIGTWLAKKREEKGLSQSDVAKRMNVTKSAVHYWETNKRESRKSTGSRTNKGSISA